MQLAYRHTRREVVVRQWVRSGTIKKEPRYRVVLPIRIAEEVWSGRLDLRRHRCTAQIQGTWIHEILYPEAFGWSCGSPLVQAVAALPEKARCRPVSPAQSNRFPPGYSRGISAAPPFRRLARASPRAQCVHPED